MVEKRARPAGMASGVSGRLCRSRRQIERSIFDGGSAQTGAIARTLHGSAALPRREQLLNGADICAASY
jgi:hypothetical protein